ncbi:MAG: 50S ribosomal protein L6 [Actinobacteria bacterium]|nr:MAG: 50S ribosomal protein L6 [Actinomycetota bacterium]
MSRIGKMPIPIPGGVEATVDKSRVTVKGPKGELSQDIPRDISVRQEEGQLLVQRPTDQPRHRSLHGLTRSLIANMVKGVSEGYTKTLEIVGVGYRAALKGKDLEIQIGYSHPVTVKAPEGISFEVPMPTRIRVHGIDKQQVGEIAAEIRDIRKPEPYKGKGIRYENEYVRRKAGKTAK